MPARERAWLSAGFESVCGFVVRAEDVAWADTPAKLFAAHGLGFPGSPLTPDLPFLDVVRIPVTPFIAVVPAVGGTTPAEAALTGGDIIDRHPFTGNGFVGGIDQIVPLWWLDPVRVPAGSELWRIAADGSETFLAAYVHVGIGWATPTEAVAPRLGWVPPSETLGIFARWRGERVLADVLGDGSVIVCSPTDRDGMQESPRGVWWRQVPRDEVSDLSALRVTARWNGLPVQVVRRFAEEDLIRAEVVYIGRDADVAEAASLMKTDAGVYEATVAWDELAELQASESTPVSR